MESRDVDLEAWLKGFGFHPANTRLKQLGHAVVRQIVANLAGVLHALLPPGREKSLVFTHLELVLMYANKALAVNGGPRPLFTDDPATELDELARVHDGLVNEGRIFGAVLPQDPRIGTYEAEQRGEAGKSHASLDEALEKATADGSIFSSLPFPVPQAVQEQAAGPTPPTPQS